MDETDKRELRRMFAELRQLLSERDTLREEKAALLAALPEIDLLTRVAEALAYRGIEPVSDIEKLRVAAGNIRAATAKGGAP